MQHISVPAHSAGLQHSIAAHHAMRFHVYIAAHYSTVKHISKPAQMAVKQSEVSPQGGVYAVTHHQSLHIRWTPIERLGGHQLKLQKWNSDRAASTKITFDRGHTRPRTKHAFKLESTPSHINTPFTPSGHQYSNDVNSRN